MAFRRVLNLWFPSGYSLSIIPKENVLTEAYLSWERAGRPEGRDVEFYLKAERFFRGWLVIPDEAYEKIEKQVKESPGRLDLGFLDDSREQFKLPQGYEILELIEDYQPFE